ncbi:hypothetical protein AVA65_07810 [Salmonella enterica subsp. enterica serovar Minnesota]|nr:hypothetical protein [Salmonella enterica subsp. enterica serovar Minnesota]
MKKKDTLTVIEAEVLHSMATKMVGRCYTHNQKSYSAQLSGISIELCVRSNNYLAIAQGRLPSPEYHSDAFEVELSIMNEYDSAIKSIENANPLTCGIMHHMETDDTEDVPFTSKSEWTVFGALVVATIVSFWWVY